MAKCKQCSVEIPDGLDYCDNCMENNQTSTDEFYLDNLLNMVVNNRNEDSAILSESVLNKNDEDSESNTDDIVPEMQEYYPDNLMPSNDLADITLSDNINKQEEVSYDSDDNSFDTDEDLLNLLDMISGKNETNDEQSDILQAEDINQNNDLYPNEDNQENNNQLDSIDQMIDVDNDNSELNEANQLYHDDILAIDELLANNSSMDLIPNTMGQNLNISNDVGKVFQDAVSAVDSLADDDINNSSSTPAVQKLNTELNSILETAADKSKTKKDKKKNFLQKLFKKDNSDETLADNESKNEKRSKTSKWSLKGFKKTDSKKVSKPKKQKTKVEIVQEFDDLLGSDKKASKAAVIIVFSFIGALCMFILIGSKTYSYSLGIKNATTNFERKRYTQAYHDIHGSNVKKKDMDIYNKVTTVMYVNKQLNTYNTYYTIGKYPEALDTLLKGLERYDKYIAKAKELGIKSDLDYVRNQIIAELESKFSITEKDAKLLNKNSDQAQYSLEIINAISNN